jgi:hypothetical protein
MKLEYYIKDRVWIHLGETSLVEGRVVEIIDLVHLNEGHSVNDELYIIEVNTPIEPVYEVRNFDQISPDADGPIMLYRDKNSVTANRHLKKVGIQLPNNALNFIPPQEPIKENSHKKHKKRYYRKKTKKHDQHN